LKAGSASSHSSLFICAAPRELDLQKPVCRRGEQDEQDWQDFPFAEGESILIILFILSKNTRKNYMTNYDVAKSWDANAAVWTRHVRAGYDVYRDLMNNPAFFAFVGSGGQYPHHHERFDVEEEVLAISAALHTAFAFRYFWNNPKK
jgi:hypothetical protein